MLMIFATGILREMAVACSRAGRPCLVADIDFSKDRDLTFWDEFYKVCSEFRYAEEMAISRAFGVDPRTVRNWKYRQTYPRKGIAQQIIDWVNQGKPMKQVRPFPESFNML